MEQWQTLVGYGGFYEVSNLGRVKSKDRTVLRSDGVTRRCIRDIMTGRTWSHLTGLGADVETIEAARELFLAHA